ncbi:MAG: hypothetical protein QME96_16975, partial [Myxococcota bacterium]|nr:hypothetical protein [Myxococcota bacterium]
EAAAALRAALPGAVVESVEPAVFAHGDGARFVHVAVVETGGPLDRFEVVQDASTGRPLFARRLFVSARGYIYDPNPEVAPDHVEVDLPRLASTTALDGELATAWACSDSRCRTLVRRATPDTDGNYLYMPLEGATDDAFAEVNAYFHIDRVNRFFEETLGFTWLCGTSRAMLVAVNMPVANAFYGDINRDRCGDVVLGQGAVVDFAYDADVIYHEFTHGVVDDVAGLIGWTADELGPDFSSGGLNEGTADYFSVTIAGDPTLGEYAAREGMIGGELAIRSADNTATCPRSLSGESHMDGRIWSGTTWEIRTAIGAAKTDRLVFDALASLSDVADFDEAGRALISQASRLVGDGILTAADVAEVERITVERGLPGCERIIDLGLGMAAAFSMGLDDLGGMLSRMYSGVQFKIEAPADATRVQLTTSPFTVMPSGAYEVYMRKNQPIHFTVSGWSITLDGYDHRYTGSPAAPTPWRILLAPWTDPPLEPGTTYHFTIMHTNRTAVYMSLEGIVIRPPPPEDGGDGGEDAGDEADGEDAEAFEADGEDAEAFEDDDAGADA